MTKYVVYETEDYRNWLKELTQKSLRQVHSRILKIKEDGHFGHHKHLSGDVWELKFNDGRRIYYAIDIPTVILLLGGNKNGQDKDIKKAAAILRKIVKS
jgi:putative addiction module killer protein